MSSRIGLKISDPEHQDDQQRTQLHVTVAHSDRANGKRDCGACCHEEDRCGARRLIGRYHSHRALVELVDSLRQISAPALALTERLQRRQTLHAVEEIRTELTIRPTTSKAAFPIPTMEHPRRNQREERENEEYERDIDVKRHHVCKYGDRSQRGDDELRQVLSEKRLQPLDALHQSENHIAGPVSICVSRSELQRVLVDVVSKFDLDDVRRMVTNRILPVLKQTADDDQPRDRQ